MLVCVQSCSILTKKVYLELVDHNGRQVEKQLLPHVLEYEKVCNRTVVINIYFEKLPKNAVGICRGFLAPRAWREISIDIDWYKTASWADVESVVFHELGHCDLDRFHNNTVLNEESVLLERPESIMHKYTFSDWTYKWYRKEYIKELCHEPKQVFPFPLRTFERPFDHRKTHQHHVGYSLYK